MSSLNLSPEPLIMACQAGLFAANFFVLKKCILEPYLTVREKRLKATIGSQSDAEELERENVKNIDRIQNEITRASQKARDFRETQIHQAKQTREQLLGQANEQAQTIIAELRGELQKELLNQRQLIPGLVEKLSRDFVSQLVPQ